MGESDSFEEIFDCLSDETILLILRALVKVDMYSRQISKILDIPNATVAKKLGILENAKLVTSYQEIASVGRRVKKYHFENLEFPFGSVREFIITRFGDS